MPQPSFSYILLIRMISSHGDNVEFVFFFSMQQMSYGTVY